MADIKPHRRRTNRVFKSLHKPLTYLGVERTLFYFVCVGAVGAFNIFNSVLAGAAVFFAGAILAETDFFAGAAFRFGGGAVVFATPGFGARDDAYASASPRSARSFSRSAMMSAGATTYSFIACPGIGSKTLAPWATSVSRRASGRRTMTLS